jgi:hypothetical protein
MHKSSIAFDMEMRGDDILVISAARQNAAGHTAFVWFPGDMYTSRGSVLDKDILRSFVNWLVKRFDEGCTIVTWNGLKSDFALLAKHVPEMYRKLAQISNRHVDMAFTMLCHKGFMVGLQRVAESMLAMKKVGESAAVPEKWAMGSAKDRESILHHVKQDAKMTLMVFLKAQATRTMYWQNKHGRSMVWNIPMHYSGQGKVYMKTVQQSLTLPAPRKLWAIGIRRRDCHGWTVYHGEQRYADDFVPTMRPPLPLQPWPQYTARMSPSEFMHPRA